jgi:hypothetical protein
MRHMLRRRLRVAVVRLSASASAHRAGIVADVATGILAGPRACRGPFGFGSD